MIRKENGLSRPLTGTMDDLLKDKKQKCSGLEYIVKWKRMDFSFSFLPYVGSCGRSDWHSRQRSYQPEYSLDNYGEVSPASKLAQNPHYGRWPIATPPGCNPCHATTRPAVPPPTLIPLTAATPTHLHYHHHLQHHSLPPWCTTTNYDTTVNANA